MTETQETCNVWADETFGKVGSNISIAVRANQEMSELLHGLATDDNDPNAPEEIADIVIILYRLFDRYGTTLQEEIDRKMKINRGRTWALNGNGHGYHV